MAKKATARGEEIRLTEKLKEHLAKLFDDVEKGYQDQRNRVDDTLDNWDLYNCRLTDKQFYAGNTKIFIPFTKDAVDARVTRFGNQLFPMSNRCVEVLTGERDHPWSLQSLIETYVRRCKLKTRVTPALLRNGDIEGQYSLYLSWGETKRHTARRVTRKPTTDGIPNEAAEDVTDVEEEESVDAGPCVEVLADADLLILPSTVDSIEEALADGGSVSIIRRWTKGKIKKLIADEEISEEEGEALIEAMSAESKDAKVDTAKELNDVAGIKGGGKKAVVYETWSMLKVDNEFRLCRAYFGGEKRYLSVRRNPFWNDRCPVLTAPVEKVAKQMKGVAPVSAVADLQVFANDTINEGADTAHFSAMPIVMTDPLSNPRVDTMVISLAALWQVDPQKTKIVEFPDLWRSALERAGAIKEQIFQTLSVNPSMIPNQTGGTQKKKNQAEIANEQQVDMLTTADAVTNLAEGIYTPLIQWFVELDHQFRDKDMTIRTYGNMGEEANEQTIEPLELTKTYEFRWVGVETARNAAQMQQQIAWVNVMKEIPPEMYPDYTLDLTPLLIQGNENVFGPRVAPLVFKRKSVITVDPEIENEAMEWGHQMPVHPADDDALHIMEHIADARLNGDPHGTFRLHVQQHQAQMQAKATAAMQQVPSGSQRRSGPGGRGGGPPQAGGQVAGPRMMKQPAGAISPDQMPKAGAVPMPRKM